MEKARSADGTSIAFGRTGAGPALILVVGAFSDRASTKKLASGLGSTFTVYEYDQRGRSDSDEAGPYSIEREVEDGSLNLDHTCRRLKGVVDIVEVRA
jgi:pimeloyl-ACP methyl ester carboxylesterase